MTPTWGQGMSPSPCITSPHNCPTGLGPDPLLVPTPGSGHGAAQGWGPPTPPQEQSGVSLESTVQLGGGGASSPQLLAVPPAWPRPGRGLCSGAGNSPAGPGCCWVGSAPGAASVLPQQPVCPHLPLALWREGGSGGAGVKAVPIAPRAGVQGRPISPGVRVQGVLIAPGVGVQGGSHCPTGGCGMKMQRGDSAVGTPLGQPSGGLGLLGGWGSPSTPHHPAAPARSSQTPPAQPWSPPRCGSSGLVGGGPISTHGCLAQPQP